MNGNKACPVSHIETFDVAWEQSNYVVYSLQLSGKADGIIFHDNISKKSFVLGLKDYEQTMPR